MATSLQLAAYNTNSQGLDTEITIEFHNAKLSDALHTLQNKIDISLVYSPELVDPYDGKINLPLKKRSIRNTLDPLFEGTDLTYRVNDGVLVIYKKLTQKSIGNDQISLTQDITPVRVTGIVTDGATQQPLAGVNVIVKGTANGTTSDVEGKFSIDAEDTDVLIVTFIGYKTFETQVNGRTVIDVTMEEDLTELNEVQIVGTNYWSTTKAKSTSNIAKISAEDISKQPVTNPLAALQGRMPGVLIQQTTGVPGGGFNVLIRGKNSVRSSANKPLYIVDGVPFTSTALSSNAVGSSIFPGEGSSPLNAINPSDIESIEVLKDADATSIYGSRGANGVILITTKKGKEGKTKFDINVNHGVGRVSSKMDLLNTQQYLEMRNEGFQNDGPDALVYLNDPEYAIYFPDLKIWDQNRYTDWQKILLGKKTKITNVQTSISGGNSNTQFLLGGGYYKEGSVFPGDFYYQKGSIHINLNHKSNNEKFNITFSASFIGDKNTLPRYDLTSTALFLAPNAPTLYDENGNLNWEDGTWSNPLALYTKQGYQGNTKNLMSNALLSYAITPDLLIKASLGQTNIRLKEFATTPISSYSPSSGVTTGSATYGNNDVNTWIIEPQAQYARSIAKGKFSILIGSTFQQNIQEGQSLTANGFKSDAILENIKFATSVNVNDFTYTKYRYNAFFGRINYDWEGKYILNLTGRRDGSSRFGPDKQFANFASIGVAWILSNEGFFKNVSFISFSKLRASYGSTGNDQIGDYQYLDTYSASSYPYNDIAGLLPTRLVNPDYSWEANKKLEAALELGFLEDRILFNASLYRHQSSNQLVGYSLPATTGFSSVQYNLPATVQNTGLELELRTINVQTNSITWQSSINFTIARNRLVEFPDIENYPSYANTLEVGKSLNLIKGYHFLGVDPQAGVYTFQDIDENGSGTDYPADWQGIGKTDPDFYGGFQNTLSYKGFELDIFFQFVKQMGYNYMYAFGNPGTASNQPVEVMDRWRMPGDVSRIQQFTQNDGSIVGEIYYKNRTSNNGLSDASFMRLKNIYFSWQLPNKWSSKLKTQYIKIYLQGQNLFTLTDYLGLDPETQSLSLPPIRVVTVGAQISF